MGKKAKGGANLGKSLIRDRFGPSRMRKNAGDSSMLHSAEINDGYDWGRLNLQSVTEESSFQEFLSTAELAGTEFHAEKLNIKFINPKSHIGILSPEEKKKILEEHKKHKNFLKIPRRPKWDESTTPEELQNLEKEQFLEWRRQLAVLQESQDLLLTPYEKNLEFWRQLWRVVERSDVVVQIVDGRNPLLFRCEDLEDYVKQVNPGKMNMILINKADLLTEAQRQAWANYFSNISVRIAFFSATLAAEKDVIEEGDETEETEESVETDEAAEAEETEEASEAEETDQAEEAEETEEAEEAEEQNLEDKQKKDESSIHGRSGDCCEEIIVAEKSSTCNLRSNEDPKASTKNNFSNQSSSGNETKNTDNAITKGEACSLREIKECVEDIEYCSEAKGKLENVENSSKLLNRSELISFLKTIYHGKTFTEGVTTIGLVGYPNVGKSSTINTLLRDKKVSVSATPGKTKHFQTLYLDKDLLLCDCPGLVMPSFVTTKADMILNGILPIDQLRDHVPAVTLLGTLIPRHIIEDMYGIMLPLPLEGEDPDRPPTAEEILNAYGYNRGFMTQNGQPDNPRSARYVLKDFVNGKLLYCVAPPALKQEEFHLFPPRRRIVSANRQLPEKTIRASKASKISGADVDKAFFQSNSSSAHARGVLGKSYGIPQQLSSQSGLASVAGSKQSLLIEEKPWKKVNKHCNKKKREKSRRLYAHLDRH